MEYQLSAYTDTGISKKINQDSLCVRRSTFGEKSEAVLAVVCDGLGGLEKGEFASALAVTVMGRWFDDRLPQLPALCVQGFAAVRQEWQQLLEELHGQLAGRAADANVQMGTTLTAFLAAGDRYLTVNIGDSRIYERTRMLRQLTQDQSLVAREIAAGHITAQQAKNHPQRNVLLQCLGMGTLTSPVFTEGRVRSNALYLLCSDGLVHEISHSELEEKLNPFCLNEREDMNRVLREIVEICKQRKEPDNITAVLLHAKESACRNGAAGQYRFAHLWKKPGSQPDIKAPPILLETAQIIHTDEHM